MLEPIDNQQYKKSNDQTEGTLTHARIPWYQSCIDGRYFSVCVSALAMFHARKLINIETLQMISVAKKKPIDLI